MNENKVLQATERYEALNRLKNNVDFIKLIEQEFLAQKKEELLSGLHAQSIESRMKVQEQLVGLSYFEAYLTGIVEEYNDAIVLDTYLRETEDATK